MSTLHTINQLVVSLMCSIYILFVLVYGDIGLNIGLMFQTFLGIIQILISIALIFHFEKFSSKIKNQLFGYYALTILVLTLVFSETILNTPISLSLIPMSIAIYFLHITKQIKQKLS